MGLKFVYPEFLFALIFISVPIIIHLFNFRRYKKIFFTNVRFLKEVKEETTSRSKIKHLLVLISRLLTVIFLVAAFAQPYIPSSDKATITNSRVVSVFIDNSFSMEANGREGTLLDEAKSRAREIAKAYQPSDQYQLLTCDFEPAHQRLVNRDDFMDLIDQVRISPSVKSLSEILSRQREAMNHSESKLKTAFIISDFQRTTTDLANCKADSAITVTLVPVKSELRNNVYIDSCWFTTPFVQLNVPCEVNIRVQNAADAPIENVPVKLNIGGIQKSLASLSVAARGSSVIHMTFNISSPGWQEARVSLTDNPITFDDQYFFSFEVAENMQVISINTTNESPYLKALFGSSAFFQLENMKQAQVDYNLFAKTQEIILNELPEISTGLADELRKFVRNGGSLLIFPDSNPDYQSYLDFMLSMNTDAYATVNTSEDKVSRIDTKSDLFADVFEKVPENMDLPNVQKHFEMTASAKTNKEVLLKLQGGDPLVSRYGFGAGKVYIFSVPLNPGYSGLSRHAVFVPMMYKIALLSRTSPALSYTLGRNTSVNIGNKQVGGEDVFHLVNEAGKIDVIPAHRAGPSGVVIDIPSEISSAGNYNLTYKDKVNAVISLNYDRKESEMNVYNVDELTSQSETARLFNFKSLSPGSRDISSVIRELNEGTRLWRLCIILVLCFLMAEILLLKFLK